MPLKVVVPAATVPAAITTSGLLGTQSNTSIAETSKQSVK